MQCGIVLHPQEFVCLSLNVLADLVTMSRPIEKRPLDEHIQGSLENSGPLLCLLFSIEDILPSIWRR